jgi:hypothetical protein
MDRITVNKEHLIETLERNRAEHREIFEKAQVVYREQMVRELDQALDDAKNGRKIVRFINLPEPEDHTKDFDTAIAMLTWDTGDTVELDRRDFKRYIENKWEWEGTFAANTMSYSAMLDEEEERRRDS